MVAQVQSKSFFPSLAQEELKRPNQVLLRSSDQNHAVSLQFNHDLKIELNGKAQAYHAIAPSVSRYMGTATGVYRTSQLFDKGLTLMSHVASMCNCRCASNLSATAKQFHTSWGTGATLPRAVALIAEMPEAVRNAKQVLQNDRLPASQWLYALEGACNRALETVGLCGYSLSLFIRDIPVAKTVDKAVSGVASWALFFRDWMELHVSASDARALHSVDSSQLGGAMQKVVGDSRRYHYLSTVKCICTVAGSILGLGLFALGISSLMVKLAVLTTSLTSTVLSIGRDLYKETMPFSPIKLLDSKQAALLPV